MAELPADMFAFFSAHLQSYLDNGVEGHIVDLRPFGGVEHAPTLLLKTVGRRSGRDFLTPLVYGQVPSGYVVIASKGGADEHPGWYLNLLAQAKVHFQIAGDRFSGVSRVIEGEERTEMWAKMVEIHPPYVAYQKQTSRRIPVVLLEPRETIAIL